MTNSIYKYEISLSDSITTIDVPKGARILSFQNQKETACVWMLVNVHAPKERRKFVIFGTGQPFEGLDEFTYVGTAQFRGGSLVFHCFELGTRFMGTRRSEDRSSVTGRSRA